MFPCSYRKKGEDEESDSEDETDGNADVEEEGEITGDDPQEKSGGGDTAEPV